MDLRPSLPLALAFALFFTSCSDEPNTNTVATGDASAECLSDAECGAGAYCARPLGTCDDAVPGACATLPTDCESFDDLICGCDGRSYPGVCHAARAKMSLADLAACPASGVACSSSDHCDADEYCEQMPGLVGRCLERPVSCPPPPDEAPVCGCDGETYANDCERKAAGTCLVQNGECTASSLPCASDQDGAALGERGYCQRPAGDCLAEGVCATAPTYCVAGRPRELCGCDGNTYESECAAAAVGVSVSSFGACELSGAACLVNDDCDAEAYCKKTSGECGAVGACAVRPSLCQVGILVCGCDGEEYGNACLAAQAGVSVHSGLFCRAACASNADCAADEVCKFGEGRCGGEGLSWAKPDSCEASEPVCACDGQVYGSACEASLAGLSVLQEAECPKPCNSSSDCGESEYCSRCDGTGLCLPRPTSCSDGGDAVCGCDRRQYASECEANAAGAGIRGEGSCADYGLCFDDAGCASGDGERCFGHDEETAGFCHTPLMDGDPWDDLIGRISN